MLNIYISIHCVYLFISHQFYCNFRKAGISQNSQNYLCYFWTKHQFRPPNMCTIFICISVTPFLLVSFCSSSYSQVAKFASDLPDYVLCLTRFNSSYHKFGLLQLLLIYRKIGQAVAS